MKTRVGVMAAIILFLNALTSHLSVSEFWPLTLSREVFYPFQTAEISVFFKPTFHVLLAFPHLFPLNDVTHILVSRFLFGLLSVGSLWILSQLIRLLFPDMKASSTLVFFFLLLVSPLFFSQIVKIRSDNLSLFLSLALATLVLSKPPPWKLGRFLGLILLHYALLAATPRALFHSFMTIALIVGYFWKDFQSKVIREQLLLLILGPLLSVASLVFFFRESLGLHLAEYFKESFSQAGRQWLSFYLWMQTEPFLTALIAISFFSAIFKLPPRHRFLVFPAAVAFMSFAIADLKTDYLLASILPFLMLPILPFLRQFSDRRVFAGIVALVLVGHILLTKPKDWWNPNVQELEVVQKVSEFLKQNPTLTYFDGLGILPRSPQILSYLGPADEVALNSSVAKIYDRKPDVILYTSRMTLLGQSLTDYLLKNYREIGPNLYLKNEVESSTRIDFEVAPVFLFNLKPLN